MKEFGIELEIQNEDFDDKDDGFTGPYFDFRLWEIESPETINALLDILDSNGRIYVQSLSKSIFEPEEGDLAIVGDWGAWFLRDDIIRQGFSNIQILKRANKQFFRPEVEND